ncbi:unnamed protein product [Urochloa humidicola]
MHASRAQRGAMLPVLFLSVCAVAFLLMLSPAASADPAWLDPAVGGGSRLADSPAEAPRTAVAGTLEWAGDEVAVPPGTGRQAFRTRHDPSAFSPEQTRGLEHEAHCGPRVPVLGGAFPWPGWKPRCRGGGAVTHGGGGAAGAPAVHHPQPIVDEP